MRKNTKQDWQPGAQVRVGFLTFTVIAMIPTPGDGRPDAYLLKNLAGTQCYRFVPHFGVEKVSLVEAREMLATAAHQAKVAADRLIAQQQAAARAVADINDLLFV